MNIGRTILKKIDLSLLIPILLISLIGLSSLAATLVDPTGVFRWDSILTKQIIFVLVGLIVFLAVSNFDYTYLKYPQIVWSFWIFTAILLVLTLIFGEARNNAQRWLTVAGVQIQASEIAKLVIIITTAQIATLKERFSQPVIIVLSLLAALPLILLVFIQPHGSMALILLFLCLLTLFTALNNQFRNTIYIAILILSAVGIALFLITGVLAWSIAALLAIIIAIFAFNARDEWRLGILTSLFLGIVLGFGANFGWNNVLQDYQRERILVFSDTEGEFEQSAFNVNQAKIAIGSGQIFGKGWGNGIQGRLNFLPEHQTDFLFATYAEEFGLVGTIFLLSLYLFILYKALSTVLNGGIDDFGSALIVVISMKILIEVFINIGTNTGIIPATGIPLPLISAGGGITVMTFFSLGLIQGIMSRSRKDY